MIKTVHIDDSNQATFVCPACFKTKTVDVTPYKHTINRTKVKSSCPCGRSWTSILERRHRFRLAVDIPCICNYLGGNGSAESISLRIADLSAGGLKLTAGGSKTIKAGNYALGDPIMVDFYLEDSGNTHIKKMAYAKHISTSHIGTEFDSSSSSDHSTINAYILSRR